MLRFRVRATAPQREIAMAESKITLAMVQHVARLARLRLSDAEQQRLLTDMDQMLSYVDKLNELDTSNVPPTAQVGEAGTPRRPDAVTCPSAQEAMLANAPQSERGYFKVPKIIE
jgi:aspartyl-tRNA(Asn)/glutamyl-tRNA(Gln) amidotransferase subunit C